ncbi:MAG: hypothetical protein IT372_34105 [Polyangiaceae bacterium]|nr:hypothetical protein [Polyangiaceae bacterium]
MRLVDLAVLYAAAGVACAVAIYRAAEGSRPRALAAAALAIPLWPLWAPIALTSPRRAEGPWAAPSTSRRGAAAGGRAAAGAAAGPGGAAGAAARREAGRRGGVEACAGTALEALLSEDAAARIAAEVARAAARRDELDALLARDGFDPRAAERRVADLERDRERAAAGAREGDRAAPSPRALTTARLHLENVRRLHALRERDARALEELCDLVEALRTQLVLARFAGSPIEGASGTVSEVWARVEGLGAVMDAQEGGAPGQ